MIGNRKTLLISLIIAAMFLSVTVTSASAQTTYVTYVIQGGDTLGTIAAKYCTTWQAIYEINRETIGNNPNIVEPGMVLTIPANCSPNPTPPSNGTVCDKGPITHATGTYNEPYYTVAWGDTLSSIGNRLCVTWQSIASANKINGTLVYAGQVLFIPGGSVISPPPQQGIAERVYFQSGATSATRAGVISEGRSKSYILGAQYGQTMSVNTSSSDVPLVISIGNTRGDLLPISGTNSQINNSVSIRLPESGDFVVTVTPQSPPEGPEMNFTITFIIR